MDASQHTTMQRIAPVTNNYLPPNVNHAEAGKPCCRIMKWTESNLSLQRAMNPTGPFYRREN